MNNIAGHLLLIMKHEEYVFWTLCQIIECYLPLDYFANFFGVLVDQKVLIDCIQIRFPQLAEHFNQIDFNPDVLSTQWFLQLLVNKIPTETVNLVWDMFLLEDIRSIFRAILTAFSQL